MKAFSVNHPDYNGVVYIHAETRSKARYQVWKKAVEYIPMTLMDLDVRHEAKLDDTPITHYTLVSVGIYPEGCNECKCEICAHAREVTP